MSSIAANLERFTGFADRYDARRPTPPAALVDLLTQLAQVIRPKLVVAIGCGTSLSTRIWAGRAEKVIGIEPNADMRRQAELRSIIAGISYRNRLSTQTGLRRPRLPVKSLPAFWHARDAVVCGSPWLQSGEHVRG